MIPGMHAAPQSNRNRASVRGRRGVGAEPPPVAPVARLPDADDGRGETLAWDADRQLSSE